MYVSHAGVTSDLTSTRFLGQHELAGTDGRVQFSHLPYLHTRPHTFISPCQRTTDVIGRCAGHTVRLGVAHHNYLGLKASSGLHLLDLGTVSLTLHCSTQTKQVFMLWSPAKHATLIKRLLNMELRQGQHLEAAQQDFIKKFWNFVFAPPETWVWLPLGWQGVADMAYELPISTVLSVLLGTCQLTALMSPCSCCPNDLPALRLKLCLSKALMLALVVAW